MSIFLLMALAASDPSATYQWDSIPIERIDASDLAYYCGSKDNSKTFTLTFNNSKNGQNLKLEFISGDFDGVQKVVSVDNAITAAKFDPSPTNTSWLVEHSYVTGNSKIGLNLILHTTTRAEFDVDNGANSFSARCIKLPPKPKPAVGNDKAAQ